MNGITILAEHFCRGIELEGLIAEFLIFGLLTVFTVVFYVSVIRTTNDEATRNTSIICLIILTIIFIIFGMFEIKDYYTTHMEYTITIDDSVGFNEFHNKYEIISVDGEIYRVIEK